MVAGTPGSSPSVFSACSPLVPPPLTALLFSQRGFDGAGRGGEDCWGPGVGWGTGTGDKGQGTDAVRPALAPQSLGSRCTSPFRGDAVGTRRQPHFRGETSPTSARPQSCKVLCSSPSAREAAEATLIKLIVLRVPGLEAGSAVRRVGCEGWHLPGTLLPAGFGISMRYQLPGAVSKARGISWGLPTA